MVREKNFPPQSAECKAEAGGRRLVIRTPSYALRFQVSAPFFNFSFLRLRLSFGR